MEERRDDNEELKHVCKLCNKRYPSGKSLGGHMRSHVIANSQKNKPTIIIPKKVIHFDDDDDEDDDDDYDDDDERGDEGKPSGYGLRENPKKTWRLVDSTLNNINNTGKQQQQQQQQQAGHHFQAQERVCKQCGKGFQSLKALCGHMSSHSDKDRNFNKEEDDNSWSSGDYCKTHLISAAMESHSDNNNDNNNSNLKRQTRSSLSRYKSLTAVESPSPTAANGNGGSSSNHSEIDQHEQEEVAMCLMMLSRDSSSPVHHHHHNYNNNINTAATNNKTCFNITTAAESSDNNSVILEGGSSSNYNNHNHNHNKRKVFCLNKDYDHGKKIKQEVAAVAAAAQHEMDNSDSGYFENGAKELESDDDSVDFARNYGFKRPKTEFGSKLLADSFNNYEDGGLRKSKVREMGSFSFDNNSPESDENSSKKMMMMKQAYYYPNSSNINGNDDKKGSKYECWVCNKTFKTHQALGGHIISHRKSNGAENSGLLENKASAKKVGATTTAKGVVPNKAKKAKGHKCPYCTRVFKSGQALGGHKRSHMIGSNSHLLNLDRSKPDRAAPARLEPDQQNQQQQQQQVQPPLLDLNLPAPMEEEGSGNSQFVAW